MRHSFNTGRAYSTGGQVIRAEVVGARVFFHDETRMVAGSFEHHGMADDCSGRDLQTLVMSAYDGGAYRDELLPIAGQAVRQYPPQTT